MIDSMEQSVKENNKQIEALNLRIRKIEIESYKAQYRLSLQIRNLTSVIKVKDQEIASKEHEINIKNQVIETIENSWSMAITQPLRIVLSFLRRAKHAVALFGLAVKHGGGFWGASLKAVRLYRMHGFKGVMSGFRSVTLSKQKEG